jgi:DnaK suppressor protein
MNNQEKDRYKKLLLDKKKDLGEKLSEFFSESKDMDSGDARDPVDKAESSYTKEFLLSLSDSERAQLKKIDAALKRLENDEFGRCRTCDKPIGEKRLNVIPWASLCIECQEKEEQGIY